MSQFKTYCDDVAKATGRTEENEYRGVWTDEWGYNAFQREQWWNLLIGNFYGIADPSLLKHGRLLSRKIRLSFFATVLTVIVYAFIVEKIAR